MRRHILDHTRIQSLSLALHGRQQVQVPRIRSLETKRCVGDGRSGRHVFNHWSWSCIGDSGCGRRCISDSRFRCHMKGNWSRCSGPRRGSRQQEQKIRPLELALRQFEHRPTLGIASCDGTCWPPIICKEKLFMSPHTAQEPLAPSYRSTSHGRVPQKCRPLGFNTAHKMLRFATGV